MAELRYCVWRPTTRTPRLSLPQRHRREFPPRAPSGTGPVELTPSVRLPFGRCKQSRGALPHRRATGLMKSWDRSISNRMHLSSVIWIGIALLGFVAVVLVVRSASAVTLRKLGLMSGQWMAEHRAGQPGDPTY